MFINFATLKNNSNNSFDELESFIQQIHRNKDWNPQENIPIMIVANKMDLEDEREVSPFGN